MPGTACTVFLTVTGLEALVLASRLVSARGRTEHLRLLLLVVALAADEVSGGGIGRSLCLLAVAAAQGNVLAPRHRLTTIQNITALASAGLLVALGLAGLVLWPVTIGLLLVLEGFTLVQLGLERHWMGGWVFAALLVSGALWLGGRVLGSIPGLPRLPAPGLPLALALIPAVPAWWFAPDGPHVSRWRRRAAGLEGRLERAEALIAAQSRLTALGFVAGGAAHEFRSALSGIGGLAGWARSSPLVASKDEALDTIRARAEAANQAVIPLLEQIAGGERDAPHSVDLARDLAPLLAFVRATFRRDGIGLVFQAAAGAVATVRKRELEHILINLLRNAADATRAARPSGASIRVRATRTPGTVTIEVEDDAGGVPQDRLPLLFTPSRPGRGTGVGLYIARGLALRNGGSLEYEPTAGGSLFRLVLPAEGPGHV